MNVEVTEITIARFLELAKSTKPSEAGKKIIDLIESGYTFTVINRHHANGGTIVWVTPSGNQMWAGHIYKAFFNLTWKVERLLNVRSIKIIGLWA